MLKDGTYAAWYKTPLDQGTGIVHVADGQIWGCDSLMTYPVLFVRVRLLGPIDAAAHLV
ncbi:hypothetical protein ABIF68_008760 [Bradyrhizobium japonicum]